MTITTLESIASLNASKTVGRRTPMQQKIFGVILDGYVDSFESRFMASLTAIIPRSTLSPYTMSVETFAPSASTKLQFR